MSHAKTRSPQPHDDHNVSSTDPLTSAAAPEGTHAAPPPSGTNRTAPVQTESSAAVEANFSADEVAIGIGIARKAEPADATCRGDDALERRSGRGAIEAVACGSDADPRATLAEPAVRRIVLHVDIDAFFAAIEQQLDPRLRGKPVIVGAGVIASCSYEARAFGLRAGMRLSDAKRLCPAVVILEGHAQVYRCFAEQIFGHCREIAPEIETYLDEAYCDLTGTERLHGDLLGTVTRLKQTIHETTGLTVTCGLGPNRMLAKLVGKTMKPDGLAEIAADDADAFLVDRPIEQLAGIGHAHAETLRSMNLRTIGELRALPVEVLTALFGANGALLHQRCRGHDTAPVAEREIPLSISRETSFHRDTADRAELDGMLEYLTGRACRTAREIGIRPRTLSVRLRYADGEGSERARSLRQASDVDPVVLEHALDLLRRQFTRRVALHALGLTLSNFVRADGEQGSLFDEREAGRRMALFKAFDGVRREYGHGVLVSGHALNLRGRLEEDRHGFVLRTPSLTK